MVLAAGGGVVQGAGLGELNRVLVELVEQGLQAQREKEKAFFALAEPFRAASDPDEVKELGDKAAGQKL